MIKCTVCLVIISILVVSGTASCSREQASSGVVSRADDQSRLAAAALLKLACLTNGFQCLPVDEIAAVRENPPGEWLITASLLTDQGEVFSRGTCCGAEEGDHPAETEFTFRVKKVPSGEYLVMDLPVYVP